MKPKSLPYVLLICCAALFAWSCDDDSSSSNNTNNTNNINNTNNSNNSNNSNNTNNNNSNNTNNTNNTNNSNNTNNGTLIYAIVDTRSDNCYSSTACFACPGSGESYFGQDAQYRTAQPSYTDNGDGTVTDNVTGLMWQQAPHTGAKMDYYEALNGADAVTTGGYSDWRVPTVKELYSLIMFNGSEPSPEATDTTGTIPFMDDTVFAFQFGDLEGGERIIDSQWVTSSIYTGTVMNGQECFFGLNFADGRIKCYPTSNKTYFALYVRENIAYGVNGYVDNGDGTVSDTTTGLMWTQADNGEGVNWEDALAYCEDLTFAGHSDWRLPNAKELQSIVNYSRSPDHTNSPAIDDIFTCTPITNEAGDPDWGFYWSSTTHISQGSSESAAYVAFGRALGDMGSGWIDVHGAGAQRSDPKDGNPADYPTSFGPQGDVQRVFNFVRCVRDGGAQFETDGTGAMCEDGGTTNPTGPVACTTTSDCQEPGACPDDAAEGCTCEPTPQGGDYCIANCQDASDCPVDPNVTFACSGGLCVPS